MTTREPDFHWGGRPVYRCQVCGSRYERVDNLEAVLRHEAEQHGPTVRTSPILAADGGPIEVIEPGEVAATPSRRRPDPASRPSSRSRAEGPARGGVE